MKKLIVVVLIAILISLVGCSESGKDVAYSINAAINERGNVVDDLLIEAYRSGEWDGSFIANEAHCASIKDGKLWVDCCDEYLTVIPDSANDESIYSSVLETTEDGSWIEDLSNGEIRLDKKGETIKKIVIPFRSFYAEKLAGSIVVRSDDTVLVYSLDGVALHRIDAVTDMAILGSECHVATWEDDNYVISSAGEVTSVDAEGIVRCQGRQATVKAIDNGGDVDAEVVAAILAYENGWDGELQANDGHFRRISYYGDVVIDNEVRGNVHLGYGYELSNGGGVNVARSVDDICAVEGETLTIYSSANRGTERSIKIPANQGVEFEWIDNECCHLLLYKEDGTMDFVRVNFVDGSVETLASNIVDANTAYDSIYFMGSDQKVYTRLWKSETEEHFYCEGARCISAHTDEGEGVILDSCGWLNYGASARIYSPYSPEYRGW